MTKHLGDIQYAIHQEAFDQTKLLRDIKGLLVALVVLVSIPLMIGVLAVLGVFG